MAFGREVPFNTSQEISDLFETSGGAELLYWRVASQRWVRGPQPSVGLLALKQPPSFLADLVQVL
jgi:hypothetical protein